MVISASQRAFSFRLCLVSGPPSLWSGSDRACKMTRLARPRGLHRALGLRPHRLGPQSEPGPRLLLEKLSSKCLHMLSVQVAKMPSHRKDILSGTRPSLPPKPGQGHMAPDGAGCL